MLGPESGLRNKMPKNVLDNLCLKWHVKMLKKNKFPCRNGALTISDIDSMEQVFNI
jgi:hypothetical protein